MKILIFSDTHGNVENVNKLLNNYTYDHIFFLGDGLDDIKHLIGQNNVKVVRGNCDFFSKEPTEEIFELEGVKFLLVHGHTFGVKSGLGALINYAKELKVNFVLFGHTHKYFFDVFENITFLNPGSLSKSRGGSESFIVLNINNKKTDFELIEF